MIKTGTLMKSKKTTKSLRLVSFIFSIAIVTAGLSRSAAEAQTGKSAGVVPDTATLRKAIANVENTLSQCVKTGDNEGAANCYTLDAKLMLPNFPAIAGRKNIAAIYLAANKAGEASLIYSTISIWQSQNMIGEEGTYVLGAKDGKQLDKGKYLTIWKKEAGKWKMFRTCLNTDLPAPAAAINK